ncbi:glycosyltransferase family 2 protein [Aeromonas sp. SrichE-2G]|uniref:glycosyltransferase family 2 protein n=1 Tax=Aeromonas sp. SrichE-2G TaxID=2823359 RepID=UPI001B330E36|nr:MULTISPECIES: glycosyltransferase family 2 protein [Aeromonas]MBP4040130.1 glycosyltransferase family 2 protein [Aeromonas sp. SrichE-2G]
MGYSVDVSVVVPAKDERDNLAPLITEIDTALGGSYDYELIYVDDGSEDDSYALLCELKARFARLRVVRHVRAVGQSMAVLSGVRQGRGDWLVVLDGDGQNDPADIPAMLEEAKRRFEADKNQVGLIGHRVTRRDDWVKRLSSKLANGFRDLLLKDGIPDTGCGLKVVRREWYLRLPSFNHMHRYIPALIQAQGGTMSPWPVNHRPRQAGVSKYGVWNRLWVGLVDVVGVWWLQRRSKVVEIREMLE